MPVDVTVFCGQVVTENLTEDFTKCLALAVVIVPFSEEYSFWTVHLFWNVKWMGWEYEQGIRSYTWRHASTLTISRFPWGRNLVEWNWVSSLHPTDSNRVSPGFVHPWRSWGRSHLQAHWGQCQNSLLTFSPPPESQVSNGSLRPSHVQICLNYASSATNPHKLTGLKEEAFVLSRCQRPDSRAQQSCSLSEPCTIAQPLTAHSEPPKVHVCRYVSFLPSVCPASMKLTEQDPTINIPGESSSGLQVSAARGQGPDSGTRLF